MKIDMDIYELFAKFIQYRQIIGSGIIGKIMLLPIAWGILT